MITTLRTVTKKKTLQDKMVITQNLGAILVHLNLTVTISATNCPVEAEVVHHKKNQLEPKSMLVG